MVHEGLEHELGPVVARWSELDVEFENGNAILGRRNTRTHHNSSLRPRYPDGQMALHTLFVTSSLSTTLSLSEPSSALLFTIGD